MPIPYDEINYDPPAPRIAVSVSHPARKETSIRVEMLIDSGADITCIPKIINNQIPNLRKGSIGAQDFYGAITQENTRFISINIFNTEFSGLEVVEIDDEIGLIGRDILNNFVTTLDGNNLESTLQGG